MRYLFILLLLVAGCGDVEKNVQSENNIAVNDTMIDSTINNKKITEQIQELSEDHRWIINAMLHEAKRIEHDYQKDRLNAWINKNPQSILLPPTSAYCSSNLQPRNSLRLVPCAYF